MLLRFSMVYAVIAMSRLPFVGWVLQEALFSRRPRTEDKDVCPYFRRGMEGQVICEGLERYPFQWGNSDAWLFQKSMSIILRRDFTEELAF